jgi:predicted permease
MRWVTQLRLRVRSLLRPGQVEQELDEELRYHLEHTADDHVARGLSPEEARHTALREMGPIEPRKEECRDARGLALVDSIRQDCGYALRALRKSPGFSTVAILSLAIGIGANTTIFTFVNAVLLRPLPYPGSERIVILRERALASEGTVSVHPANFMEWRSRAHSFDALALVQTPPLNVLGSTGAEQINRVQTTSELFRVFGVAPILGRGFTEEETRPGQHDVVILGHGFWLRSFAGDLGVLGRQLPLPDGSLTIVGVAPPGLRIGLTEPDAYTPLPIDPANPAAIGSRSFQCYGRLKPAATIEAARAEMTAIASTLAGQYRFDEGMGVFVSGLHEYLVREGRPALQLLMAVVATVLLIACVNLAGLLMAKGIARRSELALRAALGASRVRLVRQLAIESLVLSLWGGAAGLAVAYLATRALVSLTAGTLSVATTEPIGLDRACVVFTLVVSTLTSLVFGLVPALQASHADPHTALRERARGATVDRRHHRMRQVLVVTEVALAVVLLVGAGLLLRTFSSLVAVSLGFQPAHTLTMNLFLGDRPAAVRMSVVEQILEHVEAVPGVKAAGTIQFLPLAGTTCGTGFWLDGQASDPSRALPTDCSLISRGYFAAMGIQVLEGRPFERRDNSASSRVLIVNQSFARHYFPDGRVIGRRIFVQGSNQAPAEIVGVVGDIRHNGLTSEPAPTAFLLHAQTPGYITNLVVRTEGDATAQAAAIRRAIQEVDRTQAVSRVKTMEQYVGDALARPRLYATLVTCFAVIAMMLAAIGVYGLVSYVVTQRTPEIGIRLALGATRWGVFFHQFRQGLALVVAGFVVGIAAAATLGRVVSGLLFGVTPSDPVTYVMAAAMFFAVALGAIAIPASRASRVAPVTALRWE